MREWSALNGARILVTGGAGFIGSSLARHLVNAGAAVTVIDSFIPEYGGNLHNLHDIRDRIHLNISDIRDAHSMKYLVQGMDYVFNLAGQTSHMDSMQDPFTDLEINSRAQLSLLEALRQYNPHAKVIFASTRQIYGKPDYLPVDERHPLRPVDVNGINKISGEGYHILYNNVYGIRACALRLTNTYGPGMRIKDARQTFVGVWIRRLLEDQPFEVWGGAQLRDFNFVDDVVDAFMLCAIDERSSGHVFNLGSDEVVSLAQLAEILVSINGQGSFEMRDFPDDRKKIDIGDYYSDFSAIKSRLGWMPDVRLAIGLGQTLAYFREHGSHYL